MFNCYNKLIKLRIKTLLYLLLVVFMLACTNKPSDDDLKSGIYDLLSIEGVFFIQNIKKINSYILNDIHYYEINYDRHCLVGIDEAAYIMKKELDSTKPTNLAEEFTLGFLKSMPGIGVLKFSIMSQYGNFSKGETFNETITIPLIKTDNGWMVYYE